MKGLFCISCVIVVLSLIILHISGFSVAKSKPIKRLSSSILKSPSSNYGKSSLGLFNEDAKKLVEDFDEKKAIEAVAAPVGEAVEVEAAPIPSEPISTVVEVTDSTEVTEVNVEEEEGGGGFSIGEASNLFTTGLTYGLYGYIAYLFIDSIRLLVLGASGPPPV